jgi:hypothetical protein
MSTLPFFTGIGIFEGIAWGDWVRVGAIEMEEDRCYKADNIGVNAEAGI